MMHRAARVLVALCAVVVVSTEPIYFGNTGAALDPAGPSHPLFSAGESSTQKDIYLVQVPHFSPDTPKALAQNYDFKFLAYVPENSALVYCTAETAQKMMGDNGIVAVLRPSPDRRLSASLEVSDDENDVVETLKTMDHNLAKRLYRNIKAKFSSIDADDNITVKVHCADADVVAAIGEKLRAQEGVLKVRDEPASGLVRALVVRGSLDAVARSAAAVTGVVFVERQHKNFINNKYGGSILESNTPDMRPLAAAGLTGKGQVVGVTDSGLDFNRCAFYDNKEFSKVRIPSGGALEDKGHRKIKAFWALQDDFDYTGGHGTHVSGTVAGSTDKTELLAKYNGGAPDARLVFTDVGCHTAGGCHIDEDRYRPFACTEGDDKKSCPQIDGAVLPPDDLAEDFFPFTYENGARIVSNSWGGGTTYDSSSQAIDRFQYENPDLLVMFAAGNNGAASSVGTQAQAKNCLTVGASQTTSQGAKESVDLTDFDGVAKQLNQDPIFKLILLNNMLDNASQCCRAGFKKKYPVQYFLLPKKMMEAIEEACCEPVVRKVRSDMMKNNYQNLAKFSSRGPAADGRIKPEVVSPGDFVVSVNGKGAISKYGESCASPDAAEAQGDGKTALTSMSGTSMATPALAGQAALVRQYFTDGYYPTGAPVEANRMEPSSALLKATIINSASMLTGRLFADDKEYRLAKEGGLKTAMQGYGLPNLSEALPLKDKKASPFLYVNEGSARENDKATTCFKVPKGLRFKSTLVWNDYPATPGTSKTLVNDINLAVTLVGGSDSFAGNNGMSFDDLNNVEQVDIPESSGGVYAVTVTPKKIAMGPDSYPFSLVVSASGSAERIDCTDEMVRDGAASVATADKGNASVIEYHYKDFDPTKDPQIV